MRLKNSRWTMVIVVVIAFLMVGTMVWASPLAGVPSAPLQAYDATNADKVDGHHAAAASAKSKTQRANRVLWANKQGQLHWRAMPQGTLNKRYLNDDRQETISAAVTQGALLTVNNTGTGGGVLGLHGYGTDVGVSGNSNHGTGVDGTSDSGHGVYGYSDTGTGVEGRSDSGVPLKAQGLVNSTNLIEAWSWNAVLWDREFYVSNSGDVYIDGSYYDTGADFAEMMATSEGVTYEPGDLLVIGPDGKPLPSSVPNVTNLLGVYSTDPGFVGGIGDDGDTRGKIPVAITGIVPVKASAENGAILPGDLLTSSSISGHAMKASPVTINGITFYLPGTILGKALEPLEEGTGVILVLVTLQ